MSDAENAAIRKVSEEINSELTGTFKSAQEQWSSDSPGESSFKYVEKVLSTTTVKTRFTDRHLIRIVERASKGGVHGAIAALDRIKAAEYLEPRVRHAGQRFDKVVQQCRQAYQDGRPALLASLAGQAHRLAAQADKKLLEYSVITRQARQYNRKSPWLKMAAVAELDEQLRTRRRWYIHVGSELQPAAAHTGLLVPVLGKALRATQGQADAIPGRSRNRALTALKQRLGDAAALSFIVLGTVKGRVSSFTSSGKDRLHICVCRADLTGQHLGSGRALFDLTVEEQKGGGASSSAACKECLEHLRQPLQEALDNKLRELNL